MCCPGWTPLCRSPSTQEVRFAQPGSAKSASEASSGQGGNGYNTTHRQSRHPGEPFFRKVVARSSLDRAAAPCPEASSGRNSQPMRKGGGATHSPPSTDPLVLKHHPCVGRSPASRTHLSTRLPVPCRSHSSQWPVEWLQSFPERTPRDFLDLLACVAFASVCVCTCFLFSCVRASLCVCPCLA